MQTRPLKPALLLVLILIVVSSCAPQPAPELTQPIEQTLPTSTATPALSTAEGQKPPREQGQGQGQQGQGSDASQSLNFDIPAHPLDVILGRPTANSMTLSLLAYSDQAISIAYGTESGNYTSQTESINLTANTPRTFQLSNLQSDTQYFYSITGGSENTFHTARPAGSTFTFTIQADSHLDSNTSAEVYLQTLANQRTDHPDFVFDMGDTFMTDKYKPYVDAAPQYLAQRYFLGQLADTAPLFLVLGNHDGEGAPRGKDGEEMSVWSAQLRTQYFPNPLPNDFYSGNTTPHPTVGDLQNYYAFTWSDALFIVLDPYWYTPPTKGNMEDLWNPTLGEEQYQWLKSTLESSDAKWKFVFIHQLIGGYDKNGRGGIEVADLYEWGGQNLAGTFEFDSQRPGWDMPIHQLLVTNKVTAVFHGHDHLFVKQELDGIIYQEVPQPSAAHASTDSAVEYGYVNGDVVAGSGHLRVEVTPGQVSVDFVRAEAGQVDYSYTIK